ncbi:MAG: hypothetical protein EPN48_15580 [Microbacteriaceae bacterium]|nr:MAG: hypothetical protein EPN48_15580 [Microbacteriaceae bacterium]
MNEHEPIAADVRAEDEAMESIGETLATTIDAGIAEAHEAGREVSFATARLIAEALGHALGEGSALDRFGDRGIGTYEALREEYLDLYADPNTPPEVRRWIDWFGTFLVERENTGSGRRFMNEHLDPALERVLVRTKVTTTAGELTINIPASLNARALIALTTRLETLDEFDDSAFQAFLTLPDVNAASADLTESFHESYAGTFNSLEDAVHGLTEMDDWEHDLRIFTEDRGLPRGAATLDYEVIEDHVKDAYDLVSGGWHVHAFTK